MLLRHGQIPIQASWIGHGVFVDHFFKRLSEHQFLDGQLLFLTRQGAGNFSLEKFRSAQSADSTLF